MAEAHAVHGAAHAVDAYPLSQSALDAHDSPCPNLGPRRPDEPTRARRASRARPPLAPPTPESPPTPLASSVIVPGPAGSSARDRHPRTQAAATVTPATTSSSTRTRIGPADVHDAPGAARCQLAARPRHDSRANQVGFGASGGTKS